MKHIPPDKVSTPDDTKFRADLVAIVPSLRAFARGLCGNRDLADDLAQEALVKAWASRDSFTPGTNFRAWIFRILRNHFYTVAVVSRRFVPYDPQIASHVQQSSPTQGGGILLADLHRGLASLPPEQREAVILMESGLRWEEIAEVMNSPLGTVKSRITRGRIALKRFMDGAEDLPASKDNFRADRRPPHV